jgi:hypothetical protein
LAATLPFASSSCADELFSVADVACAPLAPLLALAGLPARRLVAAACRSCARIQHLQATVGDRHSRAVGHANQARQVLEQLLRSPAPPLDRRAAAGLVVAVPNGVELLPQLPPGHHRKRVRRVHSEDAGAAAAASGAVQAAAAAVAKASAKQSAEAELAHHYLARYAQLLCFADYLLGDPHAPNAPWHAAAAGSTTSTTSGCGGYVAWLREHPRARELFAALHALRLPVL